MLRIVRRASIRRMPGKVIALADDLTGALEVGAKFREAGIETVVALNASYVVKSEDVIVFDTETRHLTPGQAAAQVVRFIGSHRPRFIFKKTDSTLRGNISAELEALVQLFPEWRIGYAPAYPALGRTVRAGVLHVHGVPVAETEFGRDALNPVSTSSVSGILHPELPCSVFDGEDDMHVTEAARAILGDPAMRIAAGPASLAEALAREIDSPRSALPALPRIRTCLVLNGSRHERSVSQMNFAEAPGWRAVRVDHTAGATAASVALENARHLAERVAEEKPDAIFVIGGDTAFAVACKLGCSSLTPIMEIAPGVPVSSTPEGLYVITKAGGFGDLDVIDRVRAKLNHG